MMNYTENILHAPYNQLMQRIFLIHYNSLKWLCIFQSIFQIFSFYEYNCRLLKGPYLIFHRHFTDDWFVNIFLNGIIWKALNEKYSVLYVRVYSLYLDSSA